VIFDDDDDDCDDCMGAHGAVDRTIAVLAGRIMVR